MKKVIIVIVVSLILGSVFSGNIMAQKKGYHQWDQRDFDQGRVIDNLNLTSEQEDNINDLRYEHQMQATELHSKLAQNRLKLEKLFDEDNIDQSAVMNIVEENNSIHNQLSKNRMEMRLKIHSILTPEQRDELKDRPGLGFGRGLGKGLGRGYGYGQGFGEGRHWRCPNF